MNYGLYLSAAGTLTSMHRMDVIANNLANVNTNGFKADLVHTRARLAARVEDPSSPDAGRHLLESLGGGQLIDDTSVQLRQGSILTTGDDLDLAIEGEGFFLVSGPRGGNRDDMQLSRDGRLTLDRTGMLVLASNGRAILDDGGSPIRVASNAKVTILPGGEIIQNGETIATIGLVKPAAESRLVKTGDNLLAFSRGEFEAASRGEGHILQGAIESSAVDPVMELNKLISASKAVQSNIRMMQYHDQLMGHAINTFGRVA